MTEPKFVEGMRVAVRHSGIMNRNDMRMQIVKKVYKNYLTLQDDSKWDLGGRQRPRPAGRWGSHIEPWNEKCTLQQEHAMLHEVLDAACRKEGYKLLSLEETRNWKAKFHEYTARILELQIAEKRSQEESK